MNNPYVIWIIIGYIILGLFDYYLIFGGAKWVMGRRNIAPFLIVLLWPVFFAIVILAVFVALFKVVFERLTK